MTTRADRLRTALDVYRLTDDWIDEWSRVLVNKKDEADAARDACLAILAEAEKERDLLQARVERQTDWYQQRFDALRTWVETEVRPTLPGAAHRYFSICANGSPSPHESADWTETLHAAKTGRYVAEAALVKATVERDDLAAEVERLRAQHRLAYEILVDFVPRDGSDDNITGIAERAAQMLAERVAVEKERDGLGAEVDRLYNLCVATVDQRDAALAKFDSIGRHRGMLVKMAAEYEEAAAKVARYEAPGPALLVAEHDIACTRNCRKRVVGCCACCTVTCPFETRDDAYREQHARCVAVVERAIASAEQEIVDAKKDARAAIDNNAPRYERDECEARQHAASGFLAGVRGCLAALKDGAK